MHEWARGGRNGLRGAAGGSYRYTKYLGQLGIDFEGNFYVFLKIFVVLPYSLPSSSPPQDHLLPRHAQGIWHAHLNATRSSTGCPTLWPASPTTLSGIEPLFPSSPKSHLTPAVPLFLPPSLSPSLPCSIPFNLLCTHSVQHSRHSRPPGPSSESNSCESEPMPCVVEYHFIAMWWRNLETGTLFKSVPTLYVLCSQCFSSISWKKYSIHLKTMKDHLWRGGGGGGALLCSTTSTKFR